MRFNVYDGASFLGDVIVEPASDGVAEVILSIVLIIALVVCFVALIIGAWWLLLLEIIACCIVSKTLASKDCNSGWLGFLYYLAIMMCNYFALLRELSFSSLDDGVMAVGFWIATLTIAYFQAAIGVQAYEKFNERR